MPLLEFATDLVFGGLYGALVMVAAAAAALPYGVWQGIKRLARWIGRTGNGDTGTG